MELGHELTWNGDIRQYGIRTALWNGMETGLTWA